MKTSEAQRLMLFGLWNEARRLLRGRGLAPKEADAERDAITLRALGAARSWSALSNADVDAIKAELMAMLHPGDFDAQMGLLAGARKRRFFVLERLLKRLGKPRAYADAIAARMNREGRIGGADMETVDDAGFDRVLVSLRAQVRRAAGDAPHWKAARVARGDGGGSGGAVLK